MTYLPQPLLSVILPAYNRGATVEAAMRSVLEELPQASELIVVDDASTDDTSIRVASVEDPRVQLVELPTNLGPAAARNAGAKLAKAPILAFQDSDDTWRSGRVGRQLEILNSAPGGVVACYGRMTVWTDSGPYMLPRRSHRAPRERAFQELSRGNFIGIPTLFVRRAAFERLGGFNDEMRCLEDWEFLLRLSQVGDLASVDEVVADVHPRPDGVNSVMAQGLQAIDVIERVHGHQFGPRARSHLHYLRGHVCMTQGNVALARGDFVTGIRLDPTNPKVWLALLASAFGTSAYWSARARLLRRP